MLGVLFGLLSKLGVLGYGDTKLLFGIGLCLHMPLALELAVCVLVSGGVVAVAHMLLGRKLASVFRNLRRGSALLEDRVDAAAPRMHLFGYAMAIALGTLWAIAGRQWPTILPR